MLAKRVYRLMKKHGLLLARHTRLRVPRAHEGTIVTSRSNVRWWLLYVPHSYEQVS